MKSNAQVKYSPRQRQYQHAAPRALRVINSKTMAWHEVPLSLVCLLVFVVVSSVAVVYVKDFSRRLFIQEQQLQKVETQSQLNWGKYLLEQSTLATEARVQNIAQKQLQMHMPKASEKIGRAHV